MATRGAYWNNAGGQVTAPKLQSYGDAFKPMSNVIDRLASLQQRKMDLEDKQAFQAQREKARNEFQLQRDETRNDFQAEQNRLNRELQQSNADRNYELSLQRLNNDKDYRNKQLQLKNKELKMREMSYNYKLQQAKEKAAREKAVLKALGSLSDPTATRTVTDFSKIVKEEVNDPAVIEKTKDDVKTIEEIGKRLDKAYKNVNKDILKIYEKDGKQAANAYIMGQRSRLDAKYVKDRSIFGSPQFGSKEDEKAYYKELNKFEDQVSKIEKYKELNKSADATANQIAAKVNAIPTKKTYGKTEVLDNAQTAKNAEAQIRQLIESGAANTKAGSYRVKQLQNTIKSTYKNQADIDKAKAKEQAEQTKAALAEQKANRQAARDMAKTQWKDMDEDEKAKYGNSFSKYLKKVVG
jgi:hypothetical protein